MSFEKRLKFFMAAKQVWRELKFSEKLETFWKGLEKGPREKWNPFDATQNPFFIINKEFRDELLSREIITDSPEDAKWVVAFLWTKFDRPTTKSEKEDCDGDCANCSMGKEILAHMGKKPVDPLNFENPGGIWN